MRFQHYVRWSPVKMGARTHYKADIDVTVLCGICKRDCYVAHILCDCRVDAICLRHGKALLPLISYIYASFFCHLIFLYLVLKRKRLGSALAAVIVLYL
jgi:hypothetical protein